jgi:transcriptional regulator with XRE-family HTH domain
MNLRPTAHELGISPGLLSLIERDRHRPRKQLIARIARLLGEDADDWCALAGVVSPQTEAMIAKVAREKPLFFRQMMDRIGDR